MRLSALLKEGAQLIDVRSIAEFSAAANHLSRNIPLSEISPRINELNPEKPVIVCCASGGRSGVAATILRSSGFKNVINAGSWKNTLLS
ncbi:MAG: rhodanese-like domain-containing protein [Oligoflexia bacterium]|nr:rhodanese-like domain-containing protein [Oligoflexia bacterium]